MAELDYSVRFSVEDLEWFAKASHDWNPLHMSAAYARRTPYGQPVVFGILATLASLAHIPMPESRRLASLQVEFSRPMFAGVEYRLTMDQTGADRITARLLDGSTAMLRMVLGFAPGAYVPFTWAETPGLRSTAASLGEPEMEQRPVLEGEYAPGVVPLRVLFERLGISPVRLPGFPVGVLLCATYLVGMEVPGERALFSKLKLDFSPGEGASGLLSYRLAVEGFDERYQLIQYTFSATAQGAARASGSIWSILRPLRSGHVLPALTKSDRLKGRFALVTGASRGLGAALAQCLASQGCTVMANYYSCDDDARLLVESASDLPGRILLLRGDAAEPRLYADAVREIGQFDFLICNASPAVLPLRLEPASLGRLNEFVARSFALTSTPMSELLPRLEVRGGCCTVISSAYVDPAATEYPHYVAVKSAVEGLTRSAAGQYPKTRFLLVRPPVLATDLTNVPNRPPGAISPQDYAARIVERLLGSPWTGVELMP
jgi:NAD(P)-dependent dehydrogenase (short-subunit alcohol dehydrogenase family)